MVTLILKIYSYMRKHRLYAFLSFLMLTLLLVLSVSRLQYKEDIADFLPMDSKHHDALKIYQDISGANKIFAVFQYLDSTKADPDQMVECVDAFVEEVQENDTIHVIDNLLSQVDLEKMTEVTDFVYNNIPYFLSKKDYERMDSLLAHPEFVTQQLQADKQMLMFPSGGLLSDNIQRDPLNILTPVVQRLQHTDSGLNYEMYEGHIFSPDMQKAIVMMESPYGSSETENNAGLISMLRDCAKKASKNGANIEIHIIGGPVIAVENANQIKSDSILSVAISVILILALLLFSFRNVRNILLIALSIAWGWLFAIGGLALCHDKVSVIVIGISSVILGIAVNYPLHFIAHLSHTPDKRKALSEIVMPLLVGNVTTVGAFLALVPLQSVALRDLGLFSSFLLIGTIVFVLIYLPHLSKETKEVKHTFLDKLSNVTLENKPKFVAVILQLTLVFGYFSFQTTFDANMGHINYMTDEQKGDMEYFQKMMTKAGDEQKVYAVSTDSTMDGALDKSLRLQPYLDKLTADKSVLSIQGCNAFVVSKAEQAKRLALWDNFIRSNKGRIKNLLADGMRKEGFSEGSFDEFLSLLDKSYQPQEFAYFQPLTKNAFASNFSVDSIGKQYHVVDVLSVKQQNVNVVEDALQQRDYLSFDVVSMNSAIANHLSNDFNYIGIACGCIVFFFLWLSMGSIELATLSFIPMAVSWLWILGIMALLGMQFNIVNIILATFIFGQGDDYTIFMTEGAMYEYAYRRKMLASYKHSIIISALIMFIGIGTLIVARHPALRSLAEVTIAGMFSVVLMAYLFPPLIFRFLVKSGGKYRIRPISLRPFLSMVYSAVVFFCQLLSVYVVGFVLFSLLRPTKRRKAYFHRYIQRLYNFDLHHIPTVTYRVENLGGEKFERPSIVICNHQSMLDAALFMALNPRLVLVSNENPSSNWVVKRIYRWLDFVTLTDDFSQNESMLRERIHEGYSLVFFPEGERNPDSSILRFHKGAFYLSEKLQLDLVPVLIHGVNHVLPRNSFSVYPGEILLSVRSRIKYGEGEWGHDYIQGTKLMRQYYLNEYERIVRSTENASYFRGLVLDRYRYKGVEIYSEVKKNLRKLCKNPETLEKTDDGFRKVIQNRGWGEYALLYALLHKSQEVWVVEAQEERSCLLRYCAEGVANNLKVCSLEEFNSLKINE